MIYSEPLVWMEKTEAHRAKVTWLKPHIKLMEELR